MARGSGPVEFLEELRGYLGLCPLPREPEPSRKLCRCGRKHRCLGDLCARCTGFHAQWKPQRHEAQP